MYSNVKFGYSMARSEGLPRFPIFMPGAGGGLGQELAVQLSIHGYEVIAGTRSQEKFDDLSLLINEYGGVRPKPFFADLTNPEEVQEAYVGLKLPEGTPLHHFYLTAGGIRNIRLSLFKNIRPILHPYQMKLPVEDDAIERSTKGIRDFITKPAAMEPAMAINHDALVAIESLLEQNGHITPDSVLVNTSSSLSHLADPDHPENYEKPWFYYTIGMSKEAGVRALRARALEMGASHVDFVIPEIGGTEMGDVIAQLKEILRYAGVEIETPSVPSYVVARGIFDELQRFNVDRIRTVYIDENGPTDEIPPKEKLMLISYL